MPLVLDITYCQTDEIAPEHALTDDESRKIEEYRTDGTVRIAQCFQNTNHIGTFENNDEQTGYHGKTGYP